MQLQFAEIGPADIERLAAWLPRHHWPYHGVSRVDEAWVRGRAAAGYFFGPDTRSFWAIAGDSTPTGLVRAFELGDVTPLLDLRIVDEARGSGVGTEVLRWITRFVFETFPARHRLGGYTRHDNLAMRRVFEKCGYAKEAQHRQAWQVDGTTTFADAVGYAMLRSDWRPTPAG